MSFDVHNQPHTGNTRPILDPHIQINGQHLKGLTEAALIWLRTNQQIVNALNVFPVPDGDTGTNMVLTMQAAYNEIADSGEYRIGKMAHAIAQGALMGARGNSGVILSQIWRGFARILDNLEVMDAKIFVQALQEGSNTAYKGVVRPVEGTILTVAKDVASAASTALAETTDLKLLLEAVVARGAASVENTPELLPILKQAGVVDSGGKGLFFILEGMLRHINGLSLDSPLSMVQPISAMNLDNSMENIEPGQDFEVVVDFQPTAPLDLDRFYNDLASMGTSIQVGEGDGMYRMHIHVPTEKLNQPLDYTRSIGVVTKAAIENLQVQMGHGIANPEEQKIKYTPVEPGQIAVVAVSPGLGISRIFASLGVAAIVEGGDTMNPSTEEILKSFENLPTDKIIILPNNKNIVLTAEAAASVTVKKVVIIPSQNVPQGLSAILHLAPEGDLAEVTENMMNALADVEAGEITVATRSVEINGVHVQKGQVIALLDGKLVYSATSIDEACLGLLAKANTNQHERITIIYGSDITRNNVNEIVDKVRSVYPSQEVELHAGDQPHYQLILSIE